MKFLIALFALFLSTGALAQEVSGGPTSVSAPLRISIGGPSTISYFYSNSTPGAAVGWLGQVQNIGGVNGVGYNWDWTTNSAGGGFDLDTQTTDNVITQSPAGTTFYDHFDWILGPSDVGTAWGLGLGEFDVTNRVLTSPGWARDRTTGPQNSGGFLVVPIATSSFGQTITDPFTTDGTTTVKVTFPGSAPRSIPHMLQAGQTVQFSGAGITSCNGFLPANPSTYVVLSVIDAYNFTINGGATTGSGTCGGSVSVKEYNGQDMRYGNSVSASVDLRGLDNRKTRTYIGYNCEPSALVGVPNDPTSHGGDCFYGSGAGDVLANNPVTINGTTTVSLAWAKSGLSTSSPNNTFVLSGATQIASCYTPSGQYTVVSADTATVTFTDANASCGSGTGGGGSIVAYDTGDVPRAIVECDRTSVNCFRTDAATPTGNAVQLAAGQGIGYTGTGSIKFQGTNTNDDACAGCSGEYVTNTSGNGASATVTITIASPGVITDTAHGMSCLAPVYLSTSGALPTGLSTFTTYFVSCGTVTTNTYRVSTTLANALAGTSINTSGTQSGTQTIHRSNIIPAGSAADVVGVQLGAGDWDCQGTVFPFYGGATSVTMIADWLGSAGGSTLPYTLATPTPIASSLTSGLTIQTFAAIVQPPISETTGTARIKLSAAGMGVLSVQSAFTVSSMTMSGVIRCRRPR